MDRLSIEEVFTNIQKGSCYSGLYEDQYIRIESRSIYGLLYGRPDESHDAVGLINKLLSSDSYVSTNYKTLLNDWIENIYRPIVHCSIDIIANKTLILIAFRYDKDSCVEVSILINSNHVKQLSQGELIDLYLKFKVYLSRDTILTANAFGNEVKLYLSNTASCELSTAEEFKHNEVSFVGDDIVKRLGLPMLSYSTTHTHNATQTVILLSDDDRRLTLKITEDFKK